MATRAETLIAALQSALGDKLVSVAAALGEVTAVVKPEHLLAAAATLRDAPELKFEELIDLCGVDGRAGGSPPSITCSALRTTTGFACGCSARTTSSRWWTP